MAEEIVRFKMRLAEIEKKLEYFRQQEREFIEALPTSILPPGWSPSGMPGEVTRLQTHLLAQEIRKTIELHSRIQFWFKIALVEFVVICAVFAILLFKT